MKPMATKLSLGRQRVRHSGTSVLEVMVAFTLLTSVLAFSTPMIVRHRRLVAAQRDYRLALDEASNQISRLSILPSTELPQAVERLKPSEFVAARLANAKVSGEIRAADSGQHVTVSVSWGDEQRAAAPLKLAAWLVPQSPAAASDSERRSSP